MTAAERRLQLGPALVTTPSAAAELLPWGETRSMAWLEQQGLIREVAGMGRAVIWGEVLAAIKTPIAPANPAPVKARGSLPVADLSALRGRSRKAT